MSDPSLSPFLEQPSRVDITQTTYREKISRLEYEVTTLKGEKKLADQSKDAAIARYERLLQSKNEELAQLQSNFDFLYDSRKEVENSLSLEKSKVQLKLKSYSQDLALLQEENKQYRSKLQKFEKLYHSAVEESEHLRADLNCELASSVQYRERIKDLVREQSNQAAINSDLVKQLELKADSRGSWEREIESLKLRLSTMQKTNSDLQCTLDKYLQQKTGNELLRHKNNSLLSQVQVLEGYKEKSYRLEQMNAALQSKFKEYFLAISKSIEVPENSNESTAVKKFIQDFSLLQNKLLVTHDKLNESQLTVTQLESKISAMEDKQELYKQEIEALKKQNLEKDLTISSLRKSALLNQREIEFLRGSLKSLDNITSGRANSMKKPEDSSSGEASDVYLTNLERLVDEYKREIDDLRKQLSTFSPSVSEAPTKRPRLIHDIEANPKSMSVLQKENIDLQSTIRFLKDQLGVLKESLDLKQNPNDKKLNSVVELRRNPFASDQLVKQEQLDLLQAENRDLISRFITGNGVEEIPLAVYARQEHDKVKLQEQVDLLLKKMDRLKTIYSERSKEILGLISRYFGYSVEFIPNPINPTDFCSKVKLVSKYLKHADSKAEVPYIILDVKRRSLKAYGNYEFKRLCEGLVEQWVNQRYQIPCFLSALNLQIYSDQNIKMSG